MLKDFDNGAILCSETKADKSIEDQGFVLDHAYTIVSLSWYSLDCTKGLVDWLSFETPMVTNSGGDDVVTLILIFGKRSV